MASAAAKKTCFVVGPIGEEGSEVRRHSDMVLTHIIKHVLEPAPLSVDVHRADEMQTPGIITKQIVERIQNADLVVADLTGPNANAFYELALRHALRKPVVHLILKGQKAPFDIATQRIIEYDLDIAAAEKARVDLRAHATAALAAPVDNENPIAQALVVLNLEHSRNTTDQALARVLTELGNLTGQIRALESRLPPTITPRYGPLDFSSAAAVGRAMMGMDPATAARLGMASSAIDPGAATRFAAPSSPFDVLSTGGALTCANCGQPIGMGPTGRRSSDGAPIHPEGRCPSPGGSGLLRPGTVPSTHK